MRVSVVVGLRAVLLGCLCLLGAASAWAAEDKALFWEVKSSRGSAYLFGSIHVANASFYPLRADALAAFERSDHLVVEITQTPADLARLQQLVLTEALYPGTETIQNHVSADTYQRLLTTLNQLNLPAQVLVKFRPGWLITQVTAAYLLQLGFSPQQGIDAYFLGRAGDKPVIALESLEQQFGYLQDLGADEDTIRFGLNDIDRLGDQFDALVSTWKAGDAEALNRLIITEPLRTNPEYKPIYDKLFFNRNRAMAQKIRQLLKTGDTYFVVVGAGHLVGDRSVVAELKQAGLEVIRR